MSRRWRHKLVSIKKVIDWYSKQTDRVKAALYLEQECGSGCDAGVHLMCNVDTGSKVICRVGKKGFDAFELKPLPSQYMNIRYYGIIGLKFLSSEQDVQASVARDDDSSTGDDKQKT